jgi:anhydro-N-acetylmuramic acid kinase
VKKKQTNNVIRLAGLMSGTSADGVDVIIFDFDETGIQSLAFKTFDYPQKIRNELFSLFDPKKSSSDKICQMNFVLGEFFARCLVNLANCHSIPLDSIHLVGSHGQTIFHCPEPVKLSGISTRSTLQIAEPSIIAQRTGITTVADFRPADIAAGGEGAPLVPFTDYLLFHHNKINRALQNIGGIANVTFLPAGENPDTILAFDTGPGNMMIDRIVSLMTNHKQTYDRNGQLASKGNIHAGLISELMKHPYLKQKPPKSTGRECFGAATADGIFKKAKRAGISERDILATITEFTARCIADSYKRFLHRPVDEMILCGGGAKNKTMTASLKRLLPDVRICSMNDFGINPDAKEAISFGLLAWATMSGIPNNIPSATGAKESVILGKICPGRRMECAFDTPTRV